MGHCQKTEKDFEEKSMVGSNVEEALGDKSAASDCFLEGHNSDSVKELNMVLDESMMTLFNGEVKKFELQCEDPNSNCSSGGVVSSDEMLADDDDDDVAKINVESSCDAQSLEVLDQTLSMVENKCESGDYNEVPPSSNGDLQQSEIEVNDGEAVEQIEDLNGQCIPMTRLDSDMFKSETDVEKSMNETPSDKSLDTSPKNKLVRCYQAASFFNYGNSFANNIGLVMLNRFHIHGCIRSYLKYLAHSVIKDCFHF